MNKTSFGTAVLLNSLLFQSTIALNLIPITVKNFKCSRFITLHEPKQKISMNRRDSIISILSASFVGSSSSNANAFDVEQTSRDIRRKVNEAVTESDLGIRVRKSVVRGAQVIDKVDGSWERLSDRFGLGSERSKREGRPVPKVIPKPLPLNSELASLFLSSSNDVFLSLVPDVSEQSLASKIKRIDDLVRKSFERSGLSFNVPNDTMSGDLFNYWCYIQFRAYCELFTETKVNFVQFRNRFEITLGSRITEGMHYEEESFVQTGLEMDQPAPKLRQSLNKCISSLDNLLIDFKKGGFVALCERSPIESEMIDDWASDLSDIQFSIALDGDVTLNAQILLQEQGYHLVPDFPRFAVIYALTKSLNNYNLEENVNVEEYYMDTDYNSDPDKFEVKEVLLNVVIESA